MEMKPVELNMPDSPEIEGLTFRHYQGEEDLPGILSVYNEAHIADHEDHKETLEELTNNYRHLTNCDPAQDMILAEVKGQMVAYARVTWWIEDATGNQIFFLFGNVHPDWRHQGLGTCMLRHNEQRLMEIAAQVATDGPCFYRSTASNFEPGNIRLLERAGYEPIRMAYLMVCHDLHKVPDLPLPEGLDVRPVRPEHVRKIWDATQEAFRDHWGYSEPSEESYQNWLGSIEYQPELWQVAWDGDEIAGMVGNFIGNDANGERDRVRGWTENISVRRPWRRRGLARALLARSMRMFRDMGFTETALGVDTDNPNGALNLYKSMGYEVYRQVDTYQKPLEIPS